MDKRDLESLLGDVARGAVEPGEAARRIGDGVVDLPFARLDSHRGLRCGFPEVVLCEGKTPEQVAGILGALLERGPRVLLTLAGPEHVEAARGVAPDVVHHPVGRILHVEREPREPSGLVGILCAGTSDLPVAEEAAVTARALGARTELVPDVGVAGLHRIVGQLDLIRRARTLVVVAGMEGALPSVVAGLTDVPVIGVPTSVGYGTAFAGVAALLGMLNSCAAGLSVVNVDNGFGGGYAAALINRLSGGEET